MFDKIFDGIGKQVSEIFELHFADEEQKSEERKEREKRLKRGIELFSKSLNLILYLLLVVVVTRLCVVSVFHPTQGFAEVKNLEQQRKKLSAQDSIKMKNDTILELKKEIAELKTRTLIPIRIQLSLDSGSGSIKSGNYGITPMKDSVAAKALENMAIGAALPKDPRTNWEIFIAEMPGIFRIVIILLILLPILWLMKLTMKFFYFIANLISPFSILKLCGFVTLISGLFTIIPHLFDVTSFYDLINRIIPHINLK